MNQTEEELLEKQDELIKEQRDLISMLKEMHTDDMSSIRMLHSFMVGAIIKDGYEFPDEESKNLYNELCAKCHLQTPEEILSTLTE